MGDSIPSKISARASQETKFRQKSFCFLQPFSNEIDLSRGPSARLPRRCRWVGCTCDLSVSTKSAHAQIRCDGNRRGYADVGGQQWSATRPPPSTSGEEMHAPALTLKDFCDAYRVCRETVFQHIRARRLRAVKLGRKTLILRADAEVWAASLPELRTVGRDQA